MPKAEGMGSRESLLQLKKDFYTRQARREGYRSRAAFKLLEATKKFAFIKEGDCVVDLGAFPGGWTQVARSIVGTKGYVLAVDIREMRAFPESNVAILKGDVTDPSIKSLVEDRIPEKVDVVLSDISPRLSGVHELDHALQIDLAGRAMKVAVEILGPGGSFFVKALQGKLLDGLLKDIKSNFGSVRLFKPKASKPRSREIYILARGKKTEKR